MRRLLLITALGAGLAGCASNKPAPQAMSDSMIDIAPAPVGVVTQTPLPSKPDGAHTPQ